VGRVALYGPSDAPTGLTVAGPVRTPLNAAQDAWPQLEAEFDSPPGRPSSVALRPRG